MRFKLRPAHFINLSHFLCRSPVMGRNISYGDLVFRNDLLRIWNVAFGPCRKDLLKLIASTRSGPDKSRPAIAFAQ